jgi:hypothetical protein
VGLATRNPGVVVNGALALAVTFLPALPARDLGLRLDAWLVLFLTVTVLVHSLGMLGLYDHRRRDDHATHTLSAMLVAGVGYTTVRALNRHSESLHFPPRFPSLFVVLFVLAAGVLREVLEFGARAVALAFDLDPVLVQDGLADGWTWCSTRSGPSWWHCSGPRGSSRWSTG